MKKTIFIILLTLIFNLILKIEFCSSQWTQTYIPDARSVYCISVKDSVMYIGTVGRGVFKSSNYGTNWTKINNGLTNLYVNWIIHSENRMLAATQGAGIFVSTNDGNSWVQSNNGLTVQNVQIIKKINGNLYAGTSGGVFFSTDNGTNWILKGLTNKNLYWLINVGSNIYATGSGIYKSTDYGDTWSSFAGITTQWVNGMIYNGADFIAGLTPGVYLITEPGIVTRVMSTTLNVNVLLNKGVDTILAGTWHGMFKTTNYGYNWINAGLDSIDILSLINFNNNLYAGTDLKGLFKSSNYGNNWVELNEGLTNKCFYQLTASGSYLFTCSDKFGIYKSTNNGTNWSEANNGLPDLPARTVFANSSVIFAGFENGGVYSTTNYGTSWVNKGLSGKDVRSFCVNGINIFCGTNNGGIYLSTNNGDTWNLKGLTGSNVKSLCVVASTIIAGTENGIYISSDNGNNWSASNSGLTNLNVNALISKGSMIFAGTAGGVSVSSNNGTNWNSVNSGLSNLNVLSLACNNSYLFAGTSNSICYSSNNGTNWSVKNQGFNMSPEIISLLVTGNYIFAGAYGQYVWKRTLNDIIGVRNVYSEIPESFRIYQNYPNPFNPVTNIRFDIPKSSLVNITVFDLTGKEVETLVNENLHPGVYETLWNATMYPSGIYFCKFTAGEYTQTRKMVLVK